MKKFRTMNLVITPEMESLLAEMRGHYEIVYGKEVSDHKLITDALRAKVADIAAATNYPLFF